MGVVSITTFGLFAGYYGSLANGVWANKLVPVTIGFIVAYGTVYSTASLYIIVVAILAAARQRSKVRCPKDLNHDLSNSCTKTLFRRRY